MPPLKDHEASFDSVSRQQFRSVFQPSRIVLAIVPEGELGGVNVITVCFHMHCSYSPPMMAFAIHRSKHSYGLFERAGECVLAVPGERMAEVAMRCGTRSGAEESKAKTCDLKFRPCETVAVPGLRDALANIELRIADRVRTGDCMVVVGEVLRFAICSEPQERNLLSLGPDLRGYELLQQQGIHRLGVTADSPGCSRS